ncbi:hypothetical protein ABW19_dt0208105 [Dactylella cylindrospora]|nr:hypothetical protein ABW19_dt0208105 [Dactylella cylindrospora]
MARKKKRNLTIRKETASQKPDKEVIVETLPAELPRSPASMVRGHPNQELELGKSKAEEQCTALQTQCTALQTQFTALEAQCTKLETRELKIGGDILSVHSFVNFLGSEAFFVLVGRKMKRFTLHVDPVCSASSYFRESLSLRAENSDIEPLILNEEIYDTEAFEMFVQYCYMAGYFRNPTVGSHMLLLHARVYALAEKLECPPLKELSLKKAIDYCAGSNLEASDANVQVNFPDILDAIRVIYQHTRDVNSGLPPESPNDINNGYNETKEPRDGFRLLLAGLAAAYLPDLQESKEFVAAHNMLPDFNTDMVLFMKNGMKIFADEKGKPIVQPTATTTTRSSHPGPDKSSTALPRKPLMSFCNLFGSEPFTILIGDDSKPFHMHPAALECSAYFRGLLSSRMVESHKKTVHLNSEVDDVHAFEMFVQYCYFQDYIYSEERSDLLFHHAKVYALAEKLDCPGLKELALGKANTLCNAAHLDKPDELLITLPNAVALIYEHTYDPTSGKMPEDIPIGDSDRDDAGGEATFAVSGGEQKQSPGLATSAEGASGTKPGTVKQAGDGFRLLLSRFASAYLSILRNDPSFIATHHAFPDFATDVMLLARQGDAVVRIQDGR